MQRRRVCAGLVGLGLVLLFGAEAAYVKRYALAGWWYSRQLAAAPTESEARLWLYRLGAGTGRAIKLRVALGRWGRGLPRYDYRLMAYFTGCPPESRRAWQEATLAELHARPDLIYLYNYMYLFWAGRDPHFYRPPDLGSFTETVTRVVADSDDVWDSIAAVEAVCALGGRADMLRTLSTENWREQFSHFRDWLQEHEQYLIFDPQLGHYLLDIPAFRRKQPPPERARRVLAMRLPQPAWSGPLPDLPVR